MNPVLRNTTGGSRAARIAIIVAVIVFIAGGFAACNCPEFFVVMGLCSLVALGTGSRKQRWIALVLLCVAVVGFFIEFRSASLEKSRMGDRMHRIKEARKDPPLNK